MRKVAVEGEVVAEVGVTPFTGAASGTWTAGPVTYSTYPRLTIGGKAAISEASSSFAFTGATASGSSISGSSTVTMRAQRTKLQGDMGNVLVDMDTVADTYGNRLTARATGHAKTA